MIWQMMQRCGLCDRQDYHLSVSTTVCVCVCRCACVYARMLGGVVFMCKEKRKFAYVLNCTRMCASVSVCVRLQNAYVIPQVLLSYRLFQLCSYQSSKNKSRVWERNGRGMTVNKDDRDYKYQQTFHYLKQTVLPLSVFGMGLHAKTYCRKNTSLKG